MQTLDKEFNTKAALWPFVKRLISYAMRRPVWVRGLVIWAMAVAAVDAVFPLLLQRMIDEGMTPELEKYKIAEGQGLDYVFDYSGIWLYGGLYIGLGLFSVLAVLMFIYYAGRIQEYVLFDLRRDMFGRMQALSFSYYDRSASGWLLSRFTSDTDRVADVISWGLLTIVWGTSMVIFSLITILILNWKLGVLVTLSIPVMLLASIRIRLLVLKYSRKARQVNSDLTASFNEHINGIAINKSTAQEARVSAEFSNISNRMRKASYRAAIYTAVYIPVVIFIGAAATALVLFWGGTMTFSQGLSIGILVAAFDYTAKIFIPIVEISVFYAQLQSSLSAGERVFSLIDEPLEIMDQSDATDFEEIQGNIEFRDVSFGYLPDQFVLENINLKIAAGQSIALVGATGEGKTTIASLVARFYQPNSGQILIDGEDYCTKTLHSLRSQLGVVLQTPHLFKGTIRENICYGKPEATDEEVKKALEAVGAFAEFGPRLAEEIGEEGGALSMGEQQLLSFARAVLVNPRIFIMDEATSSIDTITEAKIQKTIAQLLQGRTSIIIAHRLSTIRHCDRILVIDGGKIVEDGPHAALIQQKGKYFDLSRESIL